MYNVSVWSEYRVCVAIRVLGVSRVRCQTISGGDVTYKSASNNRHTEGGVGGGRRRSGKQVECEDVEEWRCSWRWKQGVEEVKKLKIEREMTV